MTSFFQFEAVNSITSDVNGFPAFANATIAVSVMITWNFCMFLIFGRVCGLSIEFGGGALKILRFSPRQRATHALARSVLIDNKKVIIE